MKREIKADKPANVKAPAPPKTVEREFAESMEGMIDLMSRLFKNQVLDELNKSTIDKFEDQGFTDSKDGIVTYPEPKISVRTVIDKFTTWVGADGSVYDDYDQCIPDDAVPHTKETERRESFQDGWVAKEEAVDKFVKRFKDAQAGNFAKVFLQLSKRTEKKLLRRFDDKRIEQLSKRYLEKANDHNRKKLYEQIGKRVGIDPAQLIATEGLKSTTNALVLETAQWAKKLRDETIEEYTANSLRIMAQGGSLEDVMKTYNDMTEKRKNHAKFTARNQIGNFNAVMGKVRAQNLGIQKAIWVTARDERVRPCHQARDKKEFVLSEGLYSSCDGKTLIPGVDYQCRCTSIYVIPEDDE